MCTTEFVTVSAWPTSDFLAMSDRAQIHRKSTRAHVLADFLLYFSLDFTHADCQKGSERAGFHMRPPPHTHVQQVL